MYINDECRNCPYFPSVDELQEGMDFYKKHKKPYFHKCGGIFKKEGLFLFSFSTDNNKCLKYPENLQKSVDDFMKKYGK